MSSLSWLCMLSAAVKRVVKGQRGRRVPLVAAEGSQVVRKALGSGRGFQLSKSIWPCPMRISGRWSFGWPRRRDLKAGAPSPHGRLGFWPPKIERAGKSCESPCPPKKKHPARPILVVVAWPGSLKVGSCAAVPVQDSQCDGSTHEPYRPFKNSTRPKACGPFFFFASGPSV